MKWLARVLGLGASTATQTAVSQEDGDALYALGLVADAGSRGGEAVALFRRAVSAQPENAEFRCALGTVLLRGGQAQEAAEEFRAGLAIDAGHEQVRFNLASALLVLEDHEAALDELQHLSAQGSTLPRLLPTLGYVQCQVGRLEAGIETLRRALAELPNDAGLHSSLLLAMNYSAECDAAAIAAEHRRFGKRHEQPVGEAPVDARWPRRLRVGYVSPDFRSHVVASFMWPILARHDRDRFEVFCYYTNKIVDEATEGLRALPEHWADCAALSDTQLAARIRTDRIDVLVDLAGHTSKSRLGVFALRPAPVQATYLGYPNSTGLRAVAYRITDARADPPGEADSLHVERLLRLPKTFLCYRPGPAVIPVAPLPAARAGGITFGCFNNFQKLSEPFLDAAAQILAAVPDSRLLLKAKPLGMRNVAEDLRNRFRGRGIDPARLELRGWAAAAESHLAVYNEVDIALDSFPYNGTTTTCEALWMGVPVVTLAGDRHAARVGVSILHSVGLHECIARDAGEYVRVATRLAADLPRLAELRGGMRPRMCKSSLMDEAGFVGDLEHSYLEVWQAKRAAVARLPLDAQALERLWNQCHETQEHAVAIEALGRAIAADGAVARHHYMLGCTLQDAGRLPEAAAAYRSALALQPGLAQAQNNLGCLLETAGDTEGALRCYDAALLAEPGLANALYNRGNMHQLRGDPAQAEVDIARALELEPQHAEWRCALGEAIALQGKPEAAMACFRAVLEANPRLARAHNGLGAALLIVGRAAQAEISFRLASDAQPDYAQAHSNMLLAMHYNKGDDAHVMYEAHLEWARRHAHDLPRPGHARRASMPSRRLNIGYVSPNFQHHAVAWAIEPVLAAHNRSAFRTFFYSTVARPDAVTRRFMALCDEWRDIRAMSDDMAARLVRQDRIDILIDLAGHTGGGRPLLFARKPAPVQVSWQGYPNTTGLAEMDYRITDAYADPEGEADRHHTEKLVRLATGFFCYAPPADAPEPGEPPMLESGYITFGSFNNLAKVTPETIQLWSRVLAEVPQSRLIMKAHALGEESARRDVHALFAASGIAAHRVELRGPVDSHGGHLGAYREVDVALDPFPYHGTATTCEALWMGVPVVALAGRTHLSRVSVSVLCRVGLDELVAATPEEYVRKALALARDPERLRALRAGLRQRMRASPLLDAAGFARALEASYLEMWAHWCNPESTEALSPAVSAEETSARVAPQPESAQALERLWSRCHETGEHGAALEALARAIAADGRVARHHYMLGCTLQDAGRTQEAAEAYRRALALEPGLAKAQNNLGCMLEAAGDGETAMRCYEAALQAEPDLASALYNRGNLHKLRGEAAQAEADIGRALALEPQHADWRCVLGEVFVVQWKLDAAAESYRAVLEVDPDDARARFGLGNALLMVGRADEAEACFRRILERQPDFIAAHSNLLLCLHYRKGDDGSALYQEHVEWARRHASGLASADFGADVDRSPARTLNVGYVSPNFHAHPVATFIEPVLAAHERAGFRVFCYSDVIYPDTVTQRLTGLCDVWRDIHRLSHDEAARLIRQDRIDILVDLAGHAGGTRLLLFARKPAPVQVTWLGYPDTTGLAEMDYRITDAEADPAGLADNHYSEELVRLATGFLCYAPHTDSPPVGKAPMREAGRITFGCFNNLAKVTPEVIGLWSRILAALPEARLVMKAHALDSEGAHRTLLGQFERAGIAPERVTLHGAEASAQGHLKHYGAVDIALDTFPYNGTTTTCEALWMGVPVISLAGGTHASRVGASILARVGLPELVASTPEDYVRKAMTLANDVPRLCTLREAMRERMRACALLDSAGFVRGLEAAYRQMWARWCGAG